jgi:hypothetical protein
MTVAVKRHQAPRQRIPRKRQLSTVLTHANYGNAALLICAAARDLPSQMS